MKSLPPYLVIVFIFLMLPACKKSNVSGSPFTQSMCGSHNFHLISSGFNPMVNATFNDTSNTTVVLTYVNAGAVIFMNNTFNYDSTSASGVLHFHYDNDYGISYGYIDYDHITGAISVVESMHISAGAGNWEYNYSSY